MSYKTALVIGLIVTSPFLALIGAGITTIESYISSWMDGSIKVADQIKNSPQVKQAAMDVFDSAANLATDRI